jgi:hypothetical protein
VLSGLALLAAIVGFMTIQGIPFFVLFWLTRPAVFWSAAAAPHIATVPSRVDSRKVEVAESDVPSELVEIINLARNYARPYPLDDYAKQVDIENQAKAQVHFSNGKRPTRRARARHDPSTAYALARRGHYQPSLRNVNGAARVNAALKIVPKG